VDHPLAGFAEQLRLSLRTVAVRYFCSKVLHHRKYIGEAEMVLFCCFLAKPGRQAFGPCTIPQFIDLDPHRDEPMIKVLRYLQDLVLACYILQIVSRLAICKSQLTDRLPVGHIHSCQRDEGARESFRQLRGHKQALGSDVQTPEAMLVVNATLLEQRLTFSKTHASSAARLCSRIVLATNVRTLEQASDHVASKQLVLRPARLRLFPLVACKQMR
jgi:hypothetical protein